MATVLSSFALLHSLRGEDVRRFPAAAELANGHEVSATVTGVLVEFPQFRESGARFVIETRTTRTAGGAWSGRHRVLVRMRVTEGCAVYGDLVEIRGSLRALPPPRNPGQFDYANWLWRQRVAAELVVSDSQACRIISHHQASAVRWVALQAREWLARTITADISDQSAESSAIKAMVLGTREDMPEEVDAHFLNSGTLHIFSVSGLHVGLVASLIWGALRCLRLRKRQAAAISIPLVFFYALLTGWQPAAVRSAIMVAAVLGGTLVDRPASIANSLCAAGLVVLGYDSHQLFLPGCQLSFFVLGAIALATMPIVRRAEWFYEVDGFLPRPLWTRRQQAGRATRLWLTKSMAVSFAAAVGSTPLTLLHFQLATPVSLLANLLLVPLALLVLGAACASALTVSLSPSLSTVFNNANLGFAKACLLGAGWFAEMPFAYQKINLAEMARPAACRLTVFDVGKGGSLLVKGEDGCTWLIDSGNPFDFRSIVNPGVAYLGVEQLDGLIVSHGDHQHAGGASEALDILQSRQLVVGTARSRSPAHRRLLARKDVATRPVAAGDALVLDRYTTLRVLFPPKGWDASAADDDCLVLQLQHRDWSVLVMNDAGFTAEKWLLAQKPDLRCDILIKGRHGSDASGIPEFLNMLKPGVTVCASSDYPPSARLSEEWAAMAGAKGISVFDQSATGAVEIELQAETARVRGFLNGQTWEKDRGS